MSGLYRFRKGRELVGASHVCTKVLRLIRDVLFDPLQERQQAAVGDRERLSRKKRRGCALPVSPLYEISQLAAPWRFW